MRLNQKQLLSAFVLLAIAIGQFAYPQPVAAATTRYAVPTGGLTSGACDSWANACDLQTAINSAAGGDQVWAQVGTYYPTVGSGRAATFTLRNGVAVYGGFTYGETDFNNRSTNPALTILSGDLGTLGSVGDNAYHVVTIDNVGTSTRLDTFTVTQGYVMEADGNPFGGGFYITNSSPTLNNLIISNNQAGNTVGSGGGGIYINDTDILSAVITPIITNVTFVNNRSGRGGGLFSQNANPQLTNVTFDSNEAIATGGGGMNSQTVGSFDPPIDPKLTNVTFINNLATGGGGLFIGNSFGELTNVTFSGNTARRRGGGLLLEFSTAVLTNVTFYNNVSQNLNTYADPRGGGGLMNIAGSPTLNNVTFSGNTSNANGVDGGAMRNARHPDSPSVPSNPVINNGIFWDNNSTEITHDETGTVTITIRDSVVEGGCPAFSNVTCTNVINADPMLGALASNGGYTQTMSIVAQGSAIDKGGVNAACAATDQRGVSRPKGAGCDIGAYERETSVLASPNGLLNSWTNTFTWTGMPGATWYYLDVYTQSDVFVYRKWYTAAETNCPAGTACSFTPAELASLANGDYKWRILDYSDTYGYGGWSAFMNFTLSSVCYTLTANVSPALGGTLNATSPNCGGGYTAGTVVQVSLNQNQGYVFTGWSGAATGTANPVSITMDGDKTLTANLRGVTLNDPGGTLTSWDRAFDWTGHAEATWYLLQVETQAGAPRLLKWYTAADAGCAGGTDCGVTPVETQALANGEYRWRVLDYGAYGYGNWTAYTNFILNLGGACYTMTTAVSPAGSGSVTTPAQNCAGGYLPGTIVQLTAVPNTGYAFNAWSGDAGGSTNPVSITMDANKSVTANFRGVTLLTPSGAQGTWNNTFSWTGHTGATWYLLHVVDGSDNNILVQWYTADQTACAGGSACSVSPAETLGLAAGGYKWRILDYGAYGYGNWTDFLNFSLP